MTLGILPFACDRLWVEGEFERVEDGLDELVGLLSLFTEIGILETEVERLDAEEDEVATAGNRIMGDVDFEAEKSLWERP